MAKGFVASFPADRRTAAEAPVSGSADSTTNDTRIAANVPVIARLAAHPRVRRSKSKAFRPPASRAFGEVLLWPQKYPKGLFPQWRPSCARVPCDARCEWGPLNSLQSLRSFRSDMQRRIVMTIVHSPLRFSAPLRGLETIVGFTCVAPGAGLGVGQVVVPIETENLASALEHGVKPSALPGAGWLLTWPAVSAAGGADRMADDGYDNRPSQCLSVESVANEASSTDPASREHRRAPGRRPGGDVRAAHLVTLVMKIVATKVTRISSRSERRNALEVEVEGGKKPETTSKRTIPTGSDRSATRNRGNRE